ncbi:hypothetical protein D1AOALGA4SA_11970 [Olavius algarvensis Delta 1 endosymbiont]|nr:hypothetical protein D1AOALGA4SA_11970 [Olavius algarvensis Delta 1 endosymbiont]
MPLSADHSPLSSVLPPSSIRHLISGIEHPAIQYRASSIEHPVSSIQYRASSIEHPVSSIQYPVSSIEYPASSIQHPVSSIQHPVSSTQYPDAPHLDHLPQAERRRPKAFHLKPYTIYPIPLCI